MTKKAAQALARAPHLIRGQKAEKQASEYLISRGLKLLHNNYRCRHGEIDLVMRHRAVLVFVEVRYRRRADFGSPAETVDRRKQRKLIASAQTYLQQHPDAGACRFDVIAISGEAEETKLHWIRDAFQA